MSASEGTVSISRTCRVIWKITLHHADNLRLISRHTEGGVALAVSPGAYTLCIRRALRSHQGQARAGGSLRDVTPGM